VTTTTVDIDPRKVEHYTGYTADPSGVDSDDTESDDDGDRGFHCFAGNNTVGNACELRPSGIVHVDNVPVSEKETALLSLQKIMNESSTQPEGQPMSHDTEAGPSQPRTILMPNLSMSIGMRLSSLQDFLYSILMVSEATRITIVCRTYR